MNFQVYIIFWLLAEAFHVTFKGFLSLCTQAQPPEIKKYITASKPRPNVVILDYLQGTVGKIDKTWRF